MDIREVTPTNRHVYLNLCQSYEGEFSAITAKLPNLDGRFALDTEIGAPIRGFLLYADGLSVEFAAVRVDPDIREVCEFYIIPSMRKRCLGKAFALLLFAHFPGRWQIKQLEAARYATCFWTKVIAEFTNHKFNQDIYVDAYWGRVARQCFDSAGVCAYEAGWGPAE